jgi:hypothetical protein
LSYLGGTAPLDQLQERLLDVTWDADHSPEPAAIELAYELLMALFDQSSGLTTETEMREALYDVIRAGQPAR